MEGYHEYQSCIEACLKCAAICNHCASSCTKEQDIKMMARCIQLDMECAAICYASAQLMSLGSEQAKDIAQCALKYVKHAAKNAAIIIMSIVRNAHTLVNNVRKNAEECQWQQYKQREFALILNPYFAVLCNKFINSFIL